MITVPNRARVAYRPLRGIQIGSFCQKGTFNAVIVNDRVWVGNRRPPPRVLRMAAIVNSLPKSCRSATDPIAVA
ncbi:hypothetical protein GCM10009076_17020 [Erythrobacter ramosus]